MYCKMKKYYYPWQMDYCEIIELAPNPSFIGFVFKDKIGFSP